MAAGDYKRSAPSVGARLAGEGVLEIAFAGKPGSYRSSALQSSMMAIQFQLSSNR
jgi:hypothetical protein